ncbi:MAG: iron-containing alcohol dehydrogenase, partial [Phycisphaerales bacterium]
VDPELTYSMPASVTASTGLDALTQLIEVYVSNEANPLTEGICRQGLIRAGRSLLRAYEEGGDTAARQDMALASLFGGLGLANAKLGAVHGFAGPLGGMFPAPHGVICARLLPFVMETNVRALLDREPDSPAITRYDEVAQLLTGKAAAKSSDGVELIQQLCARLSVPALADFGLTEADLAVAVEKSQRASSMKGNPIELTTGELLDILRKALRC